MIEPRTPSGTMELLPHQQIVFQRMLDTIRHGYERFGFLPVETPVFEKTDILLTKSGGETEKQVYFVQSTGSMQQDKKPEMALRFDLTVPLARYVAEHERELAFPFRRYQMQRVYRGERAQKGRYREFYQCDIDVIGKDSLPIAHDAELPAIIYHIFTALKVGGFQIHINNRKLLSGLFEGFGVPVGERQGAVMRALDKLDKVGRDAVFAALTDAEAGMEPAQAAALLDLTATKGDNAALLAHVAALGFDNPLFKQGFDELKTVVDATAALGVPAGVMTVDLAIARGLDYYTGTVYETLLDAAPQLGSVCSGGRYDNLASHYTKSTLPGVGISIGFTRLFFYMIENGLLPEKATTVDVFVTHLDATLAADYLRLAADLRAAGLNTEVQLEKTKFDKQMKYANASGVPFVIMIGSDEAAKGVVRVKDMTSGDQHEIPRADVATWLLAKRG